MYAQRTATFVEVQMIAAEEDVGGQRLGWQEVQQAATLLGMRLVRDTITTPATAAVKGATGRGDVVGRAVVGFVMLNMSSSHLPPFRTSARRAASSLPA
jgi:hypothetical protein